MRASEVSNPLEFARCIDNLEVNSKFSLNALIIYLFFTLVRIESLVLKHIFIEFCLPV